ncbi:EamA domain-containing membrane protein RarD [Roseiarcus fermentans]|uniref:EamA domain-containing membrane protein RarD n=1 Tax=Roseiarcus fermentans TaxID=1473586 RepID=A0A366FLZ3_9HYPH|nr:DMT family transporter [Roseiarcus fermentans]RBP15617.1 EamA domain-containing membrane protein RarD [Roseiarcus fermentans]
MIEPSAPPRAPFSATLIGFGAVALWSSLALLTALSGETPPFELAALTFAVGGLGGLVYAAARGKLSALAQPWPVWAVGIGGLFGYHALYFAALRRAPPADASLIAYLWPLLIVLFSAALPGERLLPRHVIGAGLGFAGAATLFLSKGASFAAAGGRALQGYGLALCCAFVWSGYSVLSRRLKGAPTEAVAGFCLATAALAALCHAAFETTVVPANAVQWLAILGLGLGPVGLAFYVWDYGVKHGDIRLLGVASYAAPVLSTLILVGVGVAPATPALALACALIVGGAIVASVAR